MAAVATLVSQQISLAGLAPTYVAAGASDQFTPGDKTYLHVLNTNAATRTITIDSKVASNYGTDVDVGPLTIAATTGSLLIGPLPAQRFAGASGLGDIAYSTNVGLTVAVLSG